MTIPSTSKNELIEHIRRLGISTGDDVLVYSRLITFGHLEGGTAGAYDALRAIVGPKGTIAVPTFRLYAPIDEVYNPATSPSSHCGQLSEYVRLLPGSLRSRCPMHSHAAIGPRANILESVSGQASFGHNSDFAAFRTARFKQLFLGSEFPDSATFVIQVMALNGNVPYRTWINLDRNVIDNAGQQRQIICRYYGRMDREVDIEDWNIARQLLRERGTIQQQRSHFGSSYAFNLADLDMVLTPFLWENPSALLAKTRASA